MKLNIDDPGELYRGVNSELDSIIGELITESEDEQLSHAQYEAYSLLQEHRSNLQARLESLEANAEWDTFTIAFYGETGAGKSTIIETLRILLRESSKLKEQEAFREFQNKYKLTDERKSELNHLIEKLSQELEVILYKYEEVSASYESLSAKSNNNIVKYQELTLEKKLTASLWQKFLYLFKELEEEVILSCEKQQLRKIQAERDDRLSTLNEKEMTDCRR